MTRKHERKVRTGGAPPKRGTASARRATRASVTVAVVPCANEQRALEPTWLRPKVREQLIAFSEESATAKICTIEI